MLARRTLLRSALAASALTMWDAPIRLAFASVPTDKRFVLVILRGALDGLAAVPPVGDPDYKTIRGSLALDTTGMGAVHPLDTGFGLHPSLVNMKAMWDAKELAVFHNIASPYRDRSHFDGQNVLETGGTGPHVLADGWLNRALKPMGIADGDAAIAVSVSPPLVLSGATRVSSWMPDVLPEPDAQFLQRVRVLYDGDPQLRAALDSALDIEAKAEAAMDDKPKAGGAGLAGYGNLNPLFSGAGRILAQEHGPRIAVLDAGGWDTHINEGASEGQLARRLQMLDGALDAMKSALGPAWKKTAVFMATEFGRTVRPNGNGGTDHGTGGAAFLFGGAVAGGGPVRARWVGLKPAALKDGRDLPPLTDMRSVLKGVLGDHMRIVRRDLDATVFPDSGNVSPAAALIAV